MSSDGSSGQAASSPLGWLTKTAQRSLVSALSCGPIPPHVAFIMDGNRRYAKRLHQPKQVGHQLGWYALESSLSWLLDLGVRVVTVYAFSIENFKRDQDEVDYLFAMMIDKLQVLSMESALVERHQIRIRILGDVRLLPLDVQRAAYEAERRTSGHCGAVLNICIPYTSRYDMAHAVRTVRQHLVAQAEQPALRDAMYDLPNITRAVERALQTSECPPVDILVRTSGEHRLSDFLMWQVCGDGKGHNCGAMMEFVAKSWPEFSFWQFLPTLLDYQVAALSSQKRERKPFVFPNGLPWDPSRFDLAAIDAADSPAAPPTCHPLTAVAQDDTVADSNASQVPPSL